jgi:hypothetical protein
LLISRSGGWREISLLSSTLRPPPQTRQYHLDLLRPRRLSFGLPICTDRFDSGGTPVWLCQSPKGPRRKPARSRPVRRGWHFKVPRVLYRLDGVVRARLKIPVWDRRAEQVLIATNPPPNLVQKEPSVRFGAEKLLLLPLLSLGKFSQMLASPMMSSVHDPTARLRAGLNPLLTTSLSSYHNQASTPLSAISVASHQTSASGIQPYNPQQWVSSPMTGGDRVYSFHDTQGKSPVSFRID